MSDIISADEIFLAPKMVSIFGIIQEYRIDKKGTTILHHTN